MLCKMRFFKTMMSLQPPPPTSTFLAFHPSDNNIIALGQSNSTIHMYDVRQDETKLTLDTKSGAPTGIVFATGLNLMICVGVNAVVRADSTLAGASSSPIIGQ